MLKGNLRLFFDLLGNIMINTVLGMSQADPKPGAPTRASAIFLKLLSGFLNESFSKPNPAEANESRVNIEATSSPASNSVSLSARLCR